jgi:hypothetical protein
VLLCFTFRESYEPLITNAFRSLMHQMERQIKSGWVSGLAEFDSVSMQEELPMCYKDRRNFNFSVKQSGLLSPEDEGIKFFRNI